MSTVKIDKSMHPGSGVLALYSSRDLNWQDRWRVRRHLSRCAECERQVSSFRAAKAELKQEAQSETLTGFEAIADWSRLEREMLGNIAVGVAAARCIDKVGRRYGLLWRGAFVSGLALLFVGGWITHIPKEQRQHLSASVRWLLGWQQREVPGTVIRTLPGGIAVRAQGVTLTIRHPRSAVVSFSGSSAVAARYIDEETGEVTITNVYGQ